MESVCSDAVVPLSVPPDAVPDAVPDVPPDVVPDAELDVLPDSVPEDAPDVLLPEAVPVGAAVGASVTCVPDELFSEVLLSFSDSLSPADPEPVFVPAAPELSPDAFSDELPSEFSLDTFSSSTDSVSPDSAAFGSVVL